MPADPAEAVALFRYRVIAEATNERLTSAERGLLVRELASRLHELPDGGRRGYSRATLDRWVRAWRAEGLDGLRPAPRSDIGTARVAPRTIREHLRRRGLDRARLTAEPRVFGRFEAEHPNERWIGDVLVGPFVPHPRVPGSRRAYLFLLVDDHSRLLVHGRWMTDQNTRAGQVVLRAAILRRGLPESLYLDNGAPFANAALARTCAVLGIRLVHSRPYSPQGRGKQERLNRFIREAFLAEAEHAGIETFEQLDDRFMAWSERDANTRVHAETGVTPMSRFLAGGPPRHADPGLLREAFRWSVLRVVTRTAQVSLAGNRYSVEPALVGRRVELRFDPEDLGRIEVWHDRRSWGAAMPFVLGRHVHRAVPQAAPPPPPQPTGIDYLGLVEEQHDADTLGRLAYRDLFTEQEERRS